MSAACETEACKRARWALHVLLTLDKSGCGLRVAASLGLGEVYAGGRGAPGVWAAAREQAEAALAGWEPEPPQPLPPARRREKCPHGEHPGLCVTCTIPRLVP
jgi:hypothetical protein